MLVKLLKRLLGSWGSELGVMVVTFASEEIDRIWCIYCGQRIVGMRKLSADGVFRPECRNPLCACRRHDVRIYVHTPPQ